MEVIFKSPHFLCSQSLSDVQESFSSLKQELTKLAGKLALGNNASFQNAGTAS